MQTIDFWSLMDADVTQTRRQTYLRLVQERPELYDRIFQLNQRTWRDILEGKQMPPPALRWTRCCFTGFAPCFLRPPLIGGNVSLERGTPDFY